MTVLTPPGYVQGGTYTAKLDRVYMATLGKIPDLASAYSARQGFFGGRVPAFANPSVMNITMGPCGAVIANTFASASGDYLMANDATVQVTLAASSPTQNRNDIIGFQVKDNLFDSSGLNTAVPAVIQGSNSAGTPSDPTLPASFIPVLRAVVNATNTAPASLQSLIRKTTEDGGLLRIGNLTERAEITAYEGLAIYREDKDWIEVHDGTAWRVQGTQTVAALADITNPKTGQLALLSTDNILYRYNGSGWLAVVHTDVGGGHARYRQTAAQANVAVAATWTKVAYPSAVETDLVLTQVNSTDYRVERDCTAVMSARVRVGTTNVNNLRFQLGIFNTADAGTGANPLAVTTQIETDATANSTNIAVSTQAMRFTAAQVLSVALRKDGTAVSGGGNGGGGNQSASEAVGFENQNTVIFQEIGA